MKYAYIIGPYGKNPEMNRDELQNTLIAEYLGKQAHSLGYVPFVPHSMIFNEVFGDDQDPQDRKKGERATLALLSAFIKQPNVELWVIGDYIYNFWLFSPGTSKELALWKKRRGTSQIKYFLYDALKMEAFSNGNNMAH